MQASDVTKFMQAKTGFVTAYNVEAIVDLRGLGAGAGEGLELAAGGNQRLAGVFEAAARRLGVPVSRAEETVDLSIVFEDRPRQEGGGQEAPYISLSWSGWQESSHTFQDTLAAIDPDHLQQAGRAIAMALMTMGRENQY